MYVYFTMGPADLIPHRNNGSSRASLGNSWTYERNNITSPRLHFIYHSVLDFFASFTITVLPQLTQTLLSHFCMRPEMEFHVNLSISNVPTASHPHYRCGGGGDWHVWSTAWDTTDLDTSGNRAPVCLFVCCLLHCTDIKWQFQ